MPTAMTTKGQVTVPQKVRKAMSLLPGCKVEFEINESGQTVMRKCGPVEERGPDRFDEVAGTADIKWNTDELMALLRGED
jgi:bifunctional DNA-binding transcriptional regulator/antitoxin component of YhaV-PrlF toxin-antitoxin module